MATPLLNLSDSVQQEPKKKKKPFSRPRKDSSGALIARVVSKKPKVQEQVALVQPNVPEKKSQKRKCAINCIFLTPFPAVSSHHSSQKERKVSREAQSKATCGV
jgi:hypothetical protein